MRDLLEKTKIARESLVGNYLWKQFQRLECDWMMSRPTGRLEWSDSYQYGNMSEVYTD